jgi:POT family proton-dependent oligopeptide transporter
LLTGHPKGLFPLFFTEMWERLSFYMLVGILVLYASDVERGGLGLTRDEANGIYGTYLAFVYFTPFLGGILADKYLGHRWAVLIGGCFFATGLFLMGTAGLGFFYSGLVCLCLGNGFFKPNISAMVGNLYEPGDPKRDVGFNIFYMGINIGAAVANIIAAPIRNYIEWKWAFYAAGFGIIIGLIILVANWKKLARADQHDDQREDGVQMGAVFGKILLPAAIFGAAGYFLASTYLGDDFPVSPSMCGFLLGVLPVLFFYFRLASTAEPSEKPGLMALLPVFVAGATFFMILHLNGSALTVWAKDSTNRQVAWTPEFLKQDALAGYFENADPSVPRPDERTLIKVEDLEAKMFGTKKLPQAELAKLDARDGVEVVTLWSPDSKDGQEGITPEEREEWERIWTFVYPDDSVVVDGKKIKLKPGSTPLRKVSLLREIDGKTVPLLPVSKESYDKVYKKASDARLAPGEYLRIVSPEVYQSWNPIFVVLFTPLVVWFFVQLLRKGKEVSTARKIFYGMLLTTAAMLVMACAGYASDGGKHKVWGLWLVTAYAVVTIGELCLSPMSLSLVTKLSPRRLVGIMMGGWFVATSFGNKLSGFFGEIQNDLKPMVFFLILAACAFAVAMFIYFLLPRLDKAIKQYSA